MEEVKKESRIWGAPKKDMPMGESTNIQEKEEIAVLPEESVKDSLPEWIERVDEYTFKVTTKEGIFILEDAPETKLKAARKRCTNPATGKVNTENLEYAMISASMVEPKKGEMELQELRGSTISRLKFAVYKLYDMNAFL